jgi:hypothetical protein
VTFVSGFSFLEVTKFLISLSIVYIYILLLLLKKKKKDERIVQFPITFTMNSSQYDSYNFNPQEMECRHKAYNGGLLHIVESAKHGNLEGVQYYVTKGGHSLLQVTDSKGRTPMIAACEYQRWPVAEFLVHHSSVKDWIFRKDNDGHDASYWAHRHKNKYICEEIQKFDVNRSKNNNTVSWYTQFFSSVRNL